MTWKGNHISILIPVFNNQETLARCLDSVVDQTCENWDIVLFLDGCTDGSLEVARKYGDKRIKVIKSEKNIGIAASRNRLVKEAQGEFVAFLDADDYMLPNRLEIQRGYLNRNKEIDVCGSGALLRNYSIKERTYFPNHKLIQAFQFFKCGVLFPSLMTRNFYKDEENLFNESFGSRASDFEWIYRIGLKRRITNLPDSLISYYVSTPMELECKQGDNAFDDKVISLLKVKFNALLGFEVEEGTLLITHHFLISNSYLETNEAILIAELLMDLFRANNIKMVQHKFYFKVIIFILLLRLRRISNIKGYGYSKLLHIFGLKCFFTALRLIPFYR